MSDIKHIVQRSEPVRAGDPRLALIPGMCSAGRGVMIHQTAIVETPADLGAKCVVWALACVQHGAQLGESCILGQSVHIGTGVKIGDRCSIQNGVQVFMGAEIGDDVFIGPHVVMTNVRVPRAFQRAPEFSKTVVGRGASIGANATIVCGVTIGEYAMIGAGSVVTKDVPSYTLMVGNPAREVGKICRCGERFVGLYHEPTETHRAFRCIACGTAIQFTFNPLYPYNVVAVEPVNAT